VLQIGAVGASVYEIDTPENVRFRVERAGLASRACAWVLDVFAMLCLLQVGGTLLSPIEWLVGDAASAFTFVCAFLVQWWYAALCEWRLRGRTLGKWVVGIATRDHSGLRLTLYQTAIRNLLRIVDLLPGLYLCGGASVLVDRHGRRLGDLAAGTVVVRDRRSVLPGRGLGPSQPDSGLHPQLREVAQRMSAPERDAVQALCSHRDEIPLAVRLELFEALAAHLEARFNLERPAHLTAEKVVLYVAAALSVASDAELPFRSRRQES
jgi:uncharacterized RDD family membrane protein YckC